MIIAKTKERAPEEVEFTRELTKAIEQSRFFGEQTYYHGDLHFANMFYCFTYKDLKLVDPRGEFHGHWFYDLAKLNHSVNGKYDWIDSELYSENKIYDSGTEGVKKAFAKLLDDLGLTPADHKLLNILTASLFLSMIPLHYHSKKNQELYMAEFRRLYNSPKWVYFYSVSGYNNLSKFEGEMKCPVANTAWILLLLSNKPRKLAILPELITFNFALTSWFNVG